MKNAIVYGFLLACGLCVSAWMGIADAKAAAGRNSHSTISARQTADNSRSREIYKEAVTRQRVYRTTRSLVPLARPMASSTQRKRQNEITPPTMHRTITLQPIGGLKRLRMEDVAFICDVTSAFFGMETTIAPPLAIDLLPSAAVRVRNGQPLLDRAYVEENILRPRSQASAGLFVGITADGIFEESNQSGRVPFSLVSCAPAIAATSIPLASAKAVVKTLCASLGLDGCDTYACLLQIEHAAGAENAPLSLCPDCLAALSLATGREPALHLEAMLSLCKAKGFANDARYYLRAVHTVK